MHPKCLRCNPHIMGWYDSKTIVRVKVTSIGSNSAQVEKELCSTPITNASKHDGGMVKKDEVGIKRNFLNKNSVVIIISSV